MSKEIRTENQWKRINLCGPFRQGKPNAPRLKNKYNVKLLSRTFKCEEMIVTETTTICSRIQRPTLPHDIGFKLKTNGLKLAEGSLLDRDSRLIIDMLVELHYFWQW